MPTMLTPESGVAFDSSSPQPPRLLHQHVLTAPSSQCLRCVPFPSSPLLHSALSPHSLSPTCSVSLLAGLPAVTLPSPATLHHVSSQDREEFLDNINEMLLYALRTHCPQSLPTAPLPHGSGLQRLDGRLCCLTQCRPGPPSLSLAEFSSSGSAHQAFIHVASSAGTSSSLHWVTARGSSPAFGLRLPGAPSERTQPHPYLGRAPFVLHLWP